MTRQNKETCWVCLTNEDASLISHTLLDATKWPFQA